MKTIILVLTCMITLNDFGQNPIDISSLPVNIVPSKSDTTKQMVFYMTGDGGWNKFSQLLTQGLATKGYPVISLNSNKYFWKKKTPEQNAAAITALIRNYQKEWKRNKILLIGYSFGADVLPFAYHHLPKDITSQVENITLLSPSASTDFEVHVMVMLGSKGEGQSVPAAINKINDKPITIIFGEGENEYKDGELTGKNLVFQTLPGGHHYDGNETNVVNTIVQHVPKTR